MWCVTYQRSKHTATTHTKANARVRENAERHAIVAHVCDTYAFRHAAIMNTRLAEYIHLLTHYTQLRTITLGTIARLRHCRLERTTRVTYYLLVLFSIYTVHASRIFTRITFRMVSA